MDQEEWSPKGMAGEEPISMCLFSHFVPLNYVQKAGSPGRHPQLLLFPRILHPASQEELTEVVLVWPLVINSTVAGQRPLCCLSHTLFQRVLSGSTLCALQSCPPQFFKNIPQILSFFCFPLSSAFPAHSEYNQKTSPWPQIAVGSRVFSCGLISPILFLSAHLPATLAYLLFSHLTTLISTSAALLSVSPTPPHPPPRSSCGFLSHSFTSRSHVTFFLGSFIRVTPLSHGTPIPSLILFIYLLTLLLVTTEFHVHSLFVYRFSFLLPRMDISEGRNWFIIVMSRRRCLEHRRYSGHICQIWKWGAFSRPWDCMSMIKMVCESMARGVVPEAGSANWQ